MKQAIKAVTFWNQQAIEIYVSVNNINLGYSANVYYQLRSSITPQESGMLLSTSSEVLKEGHITIDGEDYAGWSSDDQYIVDKVIEKLGLTKVV